MSGYLVLAVRQFDRLIAQVGAHTALCTVWQALPSMTALSGSSDSCRAAVDAVYGLLQPVGEAWQLSAELLPELSAEDQYHPSPLGSYLAAITIYERLSDQNLLPLAARRARRTFVGKVPTSGRASCGSATAPTSRRQTRPPWVPAPRSRLDSGGPVLTQGPIHEWPPHRVRLPDST